MKSTGIFIIALVIYALIGQYLKPEALIALSILLILGALKLNNTSGQNFLNTLGIGN